MVFCDEELASVLHADSTCPTCRATLLRVIARGPMTFRPIPLRGRGHLRPRGRLQGGPARRPSRHAPRHPRRPSLRHPQRHTVRLPQLPARHLHHHHGAGRNPPSRWARGGATESPSLADHTRPMVTLEAVAGGHGLPRCDEGERYGHRTWAVGGKGFAWERPYSKADIKRFGGATPPAEPIVAVRVADLHDKEAVLAAAQKGFFTIPHFDGYAAVLIELKAVGKRALRAASKTRGWRAPLPSWRTTTCRPSSRSAGPVDRPPAGGGARRLPGRGAEHGGLVGARRAGRDRRLSRSGRQRAGADRAAVIIRCGRRHAGAHRLPVSSARTTPATAPAGRERVRQRRYRHESGGSTRHRRLWHHGLGRRHGHCGAHVGADPGSGPPHHRPGCSRARRRTARGRGHAVGRAVLGLVGAREPGRAHASCGPRSGDARRGMEPEPHRRAGGGGGCGATRSRHVLHHR